ncbi:pentapeptide repeat-containing protein [Nocardia miyunensis]|uniref:pentapeptide repeat-containing protein n=1 Tax=Nocardia miyunensis TaxID=282684 RepID=UPI000A8AC1E9|nr:pentapeptide repeat-containing protein [Nocardia miyunensis]
MHLTDRFRLAAEQLSSDKIAVRISGIYLFERLAEDSPADHATVYSVLAAFVRTQAPATNCPPPKEPGVGPVDIQVAMTVIGRRDTSREQSADKPDLNRTCLAGIDLGNANLFGTNLTDANLAHANLTSTNLANATLNKADLSDVDLAYATLTGAGLTGANLNGAFLTSANLTRVVLDYANLTDTRLTGTNLQSAYLLGANLTGATLINANLTNVRSDPRTQWPTGFTPPPLPR